MKNAMNYYYNLNPTSIHQRGKIYYFRVEEANYVLLPCENELESQSVYELDSELLRQGIPVHQILLNNSRQILTKINEETYVLMRIFIPKKMITLEDIMQINTIAISNQPVKLRRDDWYALWTRKIDYLEYQISQIGKKYPLIIESFSYYIGLAENAITLIGSVKKENRYLSLNHRRIMCGDDTYRLYNPFNLVIDLRMRDACDYFKTCFFKNQNVEPMIMQYLYYQRFTEEELQCFFARMLFPTYYFDIYEKIVAGKLEEKELIPIIEKVNEYENLLRKLYGYIVQMHPLPEIEWLKKIPQTGISNNFD